MYGLICHLFGFSSTIYIAIKLFRLKYFVNGIGELFFWPKNAVENFSAAEGAVNSKRFENLYSRASMDCFLNGFLWNETLKKL